MRALRPHIGPFVPRALQEDENASDDVRGDRGGCLPLWTEANQAFRQCQSNICKQRIVRDVRGRHVRLRGLRSDLDRAGKQASSTTILLVS